MEGWVELVVRVGMYAVQEGSVEAGVGWGS